MGADQDIYLRDILDAANLILDYTAELTQNRFLEDIKTQDAVLRRFEIIGEAAAYLTAETRLLFPDIPFHKMRGMRNLIAHGYDEVDIDIVWRTVKSHIPPLKETLERYLTDR